MKLPRRPSAVSIESETCRNYPGLGIAWGFRFTALEIGYAMLCIDMSPGAAWLTSLRACRIALYAQLASLPHPISSSSSLRFPVVSQLLDFGKARQQPLKVVLLTG